MTVTIDVKNISKGNHEILIINYEIPTTEQYQKILDINPSSVTSRRKTIAAVANASQVLDIAELDFVEKIEKRYPIVKD